MDLRDKRTAANWNNSEEELEITIRKRLTSQTWFAEEVPVYARDYNIWSSLPHQNRDTYVKGLAMLTLLDTYQGDIGMPALVDSFEEEDHLIKGNLTWMAATENVIHAPSYSTIFTTYLTPNELDETFEWIKNHNVSQQIMNKILSNYLALKQQPKDPITKWKAMVSSVYLETWLFYSGFYYPLYYSGQGKLTAAGEIITLIIRDEQVHGLYVGLLARDLFKSFNDNQKKDLEEWAKSFLEELFILQKEFINELYSPLDLQHEVITFTQYNANKALMNLGLDLYFEVEDEDVNPVVLNGLNSSAAASDFFSTKPTDYSIGLANSGIDVNNLKDEALDEDDF